MKVLMTSVVFLFAFHPTSWAQNESREITGNLDFNYYYDVREFTILTINALANLPCRFQYFSLVDFFGSDGTAKDLDHSNFYTEQNLRWGITPKGPLAASAQWVMVSGVKNDIGRLGVLINFAAFDQHQIFLDGVSSFISINLFLLQLDHPSGYNWQVEYFYRFQLLPVFLHDRLYLAGFADQNMSEAAQVTWVTEHQLGLRIIGPLFAVADLRYNGYRTQDRSGLGLGLEYVIGF